MSTASNTSEYDPKRYIDPTINRPTVEFTVPGEPVSKSRHKTGVRGGRVHHYADSKNVAAQARIGQYYRQSRGPGAPAAGGFGVEAMFHVQARQRRDVDNFLKLVFDGLTGFAWIDDSQVTEVSARIIHGAKDPRSEIRVYPTDDLPDWNCRECQHCHGKFRTYNSWGSQVKYCSGECRRAAMTLRRTRVCRNCNKEFRSDKAKIERPYCSVECKNLHSQVPVECRRCGTVSMVGRAKANQGRGVFCGRECHAAFWRDHRREAAKGTCAVCNGPTSEKRYLRCNACKIANLWPEGHERHKPNDGPARIEIHITEEPQ